MENGCHPDRRDADDALSDPSADRVGEASGGGSGRRDRRRDLEGRRKVFLQFRHVHFFDFDAVLLRAPGARGYGRLGPANRKWSDGADTAEVVQDSAVHQIEPAVAADAAGNAARGAQYLLADHPRPARAGLHSDLARVQQEPGPDRTQAAGTARRLGPGPREGARMRRTCPHTFSLRGARRPHPAGRERRSQSAQGRVRGSWACARRSESRSLPRPPMQAAARRSAATSGRSAAPSRTQRRRLRAREPGRRRVARR